MLASLLASMPASMLASMPFAYISRMLACFYPSSLGCFLVASINARFHACFIAARFDLPNACFYRSSFGHLGAWSPRCSFSMLIFDARRDDWSRRHSTLVFDACFNIARFDDDNRSLGSFVLRCSLHDADCLDAARFCHSNSCLFLSFITGSLRHLTHGFNVCFNAALSRSVVSPSQLRRLWTPRTALKQHQLLLLVLRPTNSG
jgi:hypothetical protein